MKLNFDSGYLIIADISGYTSYVAKAEIQNAQALLAELLTRIVEQFKPVVEISRLEGDAVFAYSGSSMPLKGETLMELIESTYIAFREGQEVYRRTLCDCEACQSLPNFHRLNTSKEPSAAPRYRPQPRTVNAARLSTEQTFYAIYGIIVIEHSLYCGKRIIRSSKFCSCRYALQILVYYLLSI